MKIIQVAPRYHPDIGGVETHVKEISEKLVKEGFEIEVICTDPEGRYPEKEEINSVVVKRFRAITLSNAYFFSPQMYAYLKRIECDIIHAHNYHAFPAFFAALAKGGRKFVFTHHYYGVGGSTIRDILLKPYKPLDSIIFKRAETIICVSDYERKLVKSDFGVDAAIIIPNGIELGKIKVARVIREAAEVKVQVDLIEYDWDSIAEKVMSIYSSVLGA